MSKNQNKTQPTQESVSDFLASVEDPTRRRDCRQVYELLADITGTEGVMWGSSIVGFGSYHYKYASGREGDFLITGFSPRKQNLTVYVMNGFSDYESLMANLGKYKTGKSCLYLKKLSDIDFDLLRELVNNSVKFMRENYETN